MPRQQVQDIRFDFRGGVNTAFGTDLLDATELRRAKNTRGYPYGSLSKRNGTKRLHDTALDGGTAPNGLFQFHPALGRQIVAIAGGDLWHKLPAATNFTQVASSLSASNLVRFQPYRSGSNIYLYFADGELRRWTGAALSTIAGDSPDALWLALYKERMFALDGTKRLYWSAIADPELWGAGDGGGFADVETYDAEPLVGAIVVGSSLLLFKEDTVARFTGVDNEEIQIDRDTEGVSAEMGLIAPNTLIRAEEFAFGVTQKGPYIFTESGIQEVSLKIEREFDFANKQYWQDAYAVLNSDAREILLVLPAAGEVANDTGWVLNLRTRAWTGPYVLPFSAVVVAKYEREDGSDAFMIGGDDGFVRDGDTGVKDDVLRNGTGGSNIEMSIELPELLFEDPTRRKALRDVNIQADLGASGSLVVGWESELGSGSVTVASLGAGVRDYSIRLLAKGKRIVLTLTESTANAVQVTGVILRALMEGTR